MKVPLLNKHFVSRSFDD